jgi:hypothetical protein
MSRRLLDSVAFYCSARPEELFFFSATISVPATVGDNTHLSQTAADGTGSHVSADHWALAGISVQVTETECDGAQQPVCESSDTPCTYH